MASDDDGDAALSIASTLASSVTPADIATETPSGGPAALGPLAFVSTESPIIPSCDRRCTRSRSRSFSSSTVAIPSSANGRSSSRPRLVSIPSSSRMACSSAFHSSNSSSSESPLVSLSSSLLSTASPNSSCSLFKSSISPVSGVDTLLFVDG